MLKPAQGWAGMSQAVVDTVSRAGSNPCPPVVIGVGIGGTIEAVTLLAKKALLREIGRPSDSRIAAMEAELLARINALGIGPPGPSAAARPVSPSSSKRCPATSPACRWRSTCSVTPSGTSRSRSERGEKMAVKKITTPLTDEVVRDLYAGDAVEITGAAQQARDAAHKRLVALIEAGEPLPFDLKGRSSTTWDRRRRSRAGRSVQPALRRAGAWTPMRRCSCGTG